MIEFIAGSDGDPREGFARCQSCKFPSILVHYNLIVKAWVGDDGSFHGGHLLQTLKIPAKEKWRRLVKEKEN